MPDPVPGHGPMRLWGLVIVVARTNEWVSMNGFRTFLASLDFSDDRIERAAALSVESEPIEPDASASDCDLERADDQPIAA